ncbi:polyadenylate-binding protein-interacting protein 3-like isoform X2 [Rhodamnia argentea]|uniref:Polyadenylate-binding protein-interacting protein 3-like isoform X2 n=1 Tax=Rhodamnia argentea TaxID=178133 RepID=A0A8B8NSG2_9MYRT|nr:polyadenylate-binding protein-interacting protein 3-like isoform X2 [Rhodamnia argentea]
MNFQQLAHPKSSANGIGRRKGEREGGMRLDNRLHSGKSGISKAGSTGSMADSKAGGNLSPSHDRLVYFSTHLIGHHVEVQVKNGSIYSGIYHAANVDKDMGIILKMARMIKDGSVQLPRANTESLDKAFAKTLVIPAKELVQVIAKDFSVAGDGLSNELQSEKQQEILIDSYISQARHVDLERELKPWMPDEDDPQCPELENVFDGPWDRGWDQFEVNEVLFGVKSTFNEDLYTTKLERGPQMRELEREAGRIAREIEGEETQDLHLAEERGVRFPESFDIDEETRFSSVYRGGVVDDSGYEEEEDILLDSWNNETFGSGPASEPVSARSSSTDGPETSQSSVGADLSQTGADHAGRLSSELTCKSVLASDDDNRVQERSLSEQRGHTELDDAGKLPPAKDTRISKAEDSISLSKGKSGSSFKGAVLSKPAAPASSTVAFKDHNKINSRGDLLETPTLVKSGETQYMDSHGRPGSSTSSTSDRFGAASASTGVGLTPSSSVGSLSSEKSNLNPHAKEFKLNPNAKSFVPSQTPVRPLSPVADGSFYYPANMSGVPQMHSMPVGVGIGPFVGHQPVIFNTQVPPQSPQAYLHPNGPHYGQHMLVAHPRQLSYMPSFPQDMPYKGRDF